MLDWSGPQNWQEYPNSQLLMPAGQHDKALRLALVGAAIFKFVKATALNGRDIDVCDLFSPLSPQNKPAGSAPLSQL